MKAVQLCPLQPGLLSLNEHRSVQSRERLGPVAQQESFRVRFPSPGVIYHALSQKEAKVLDVQVGAWPGVQERRGMTQMLSGLRAFPRPTPRLPSPRGSSGACCPDGSPTCGSPFPLCPLPPCGDTGLCPPETCPGGRCHLTWSLAPLHPQQNRETTFVRFLDPSVICPFGRSSPMRREIPEIKILRLIGLYLASPWRAT